MSVIKRGVHKNASKQKNKRITYDFQSDLLRNEVVNTRNMKKKVAELKIEEKDVSLHICNYGFIKECRASEDGSYIIMDVLIFEGAEPIEKSFVYNIKKMSKNFLIQLANKFEKFRHTQNFIDLMGCAAVIVLSENKGFLNMKVIREVSLEELDKHIIKLEEGEEEIEDEE